MRSVIWNIVLAPCLCLSYLLLLVPYLSAQVVQGKPSPAVVSVVVHAGQGTKNVPETLFGSFLEPIDDSVNNGLVAEILTNRSLEGGLWSHENLEKLYREQPELITSSNRTGIPLPWLPLNPAAGNRFELHVGDAANSWQLLRIMGVPDELTGIMQKVYLPVQRVLSYKVSLYAKHLSGPDRITVSLRSRRNGSVLASSSVQAASTKWTKYETTLMLPAGSVRRLEAVNFAVSVEGDERVDVDQFSLMPSDAIGVLDPDVIAMAKTMHLTQLRFGGNFSSLYHWRDGIGPMDERKTMENVAWGIPEYNIFGTDEFLQLCQLIHAIPQFDLNMGSGTPEEASEWVRYIREQYKGPVLFEIGNELYGKWQIGYPTLGELAARTLAFSRAVRAVDPDSEIIATGSGPVDFQKWNGVELSTPPGTFNYLSTHFIEGTNHAEMMNATPDFLASAAYATTYAVGPYFSGMQAQADASPGLSGKVHFAVTEWLFNSKGEGERNFTHESPSWLNEGGAIMAAGFFNTMLRHTSEVKIADMTGLMDFAGIWKERGQVYASPAFYVFQMYSNLKGETLLPVTTNSGTYSVAGGISPIPAAENVPYVDAVAARSLDRKSITVFCVNRNLNEDISIRISFQSFAPAVTAHVEQMKSTDRYEMNDEAEPKHVVPASSTIPLDGAESMTITLPRESVTMIHFEERR